MALKRIQDLTAAAALTGTELLEVEQGGSSAKVTAQDIANLASGGAGSGDVVGPASSVTDSVALFNGTTGKIIKDSGFTIVDLQANSITAVTISAGTATVNCNSGKNKNFTLSMTANATLAVSSLAGAGKVTEFEMQITQDATGGRTLTLPAAFKALGGSDTAISNTANSVTVLSAKTFDNGTTWLYAMQESV